MSTAFDTDYVAAGIVPLPGAVEEGNNQWPRMLKLDKETEDNLVRFLDDELMNCYSERQVLINDWTTWQTNYWAKPEKKEKNFPFKRAANIVIPLTAIAVDAIYARLLNNFFSVKPFWSIRPQSKEWVQAAPYIEEWLQTESETKLKMYNFCRSAFLELVKLGTAVAKSGYRREVKKRIAIIDGREMERFVETYNGACIDHVPLARFLIRLHEHDPQTSTWVGEEHDFNWAQIKRMALSGQFIADSVDKIIAYVNTKNVAPSASGQYDESVDKLASTDPAWNDIFKTQEIWLSFDVDKDGIDEEIVVDFHRESLTLLSIRYNWYEDLHRPYRVGCYIPVEGRIYGIGVGKQSEQFQPLITTIHNQRLDNSTLLNMAQLAIKKNIGYGPGEPLFPGKMWFLDDPSKDIREVKLTDTPQAMMNNEQFAGVYWEKLTGANEVILGLPQEGTPGTATGDITRLQEGNKKYDMVSKNTRVWLSEIGTDTISNYQQFGDQEHHWLVQGENGEWVDQMLRMPAQLVRQGAIVDLSVTDSITNKTVQRQEIMGMFSVLSGYYKETMATAATLGNPQLFGIVGMAAIEAGDYLVTQFVQTYKEANIEPEKLLLGPRIAELLNAAVGPTPFGGAGGSQDSQGTQSLAQLLTLIGPGGQPAPTGNNGSNGRGRSIPSNSTS